MPRSPCCTVLLYHCAATTTTVATTAESKYLVGIDARVAEVFVAVATMWRHRMLVFTRTRRWRHGPGHFWKARWTAGTGERFVWAHHRTPRWTGRWKNLVKKTEIRCHDLYFLCNRLKICHFPIMFSLQNWLHFYKIIRRWDANSQPSKLWTPIITTKPELRHILTNGWVPLFNTWLVCSNRQATNKVAILDWDCHKCFFYFYLKGVMGDGAMALLNAFFIDSPSTTMALLLLSLTICCHWLSAFIRLGVVGGAGLGNVNCVGQGWPDLLDDVLEGQLGRKGATAGGVWSSKNII